MKNFTDLINYTYEQKRLRKWPHIYWAIDLHDTVIEGKYNKFNEGANIYPYAKDVLDYLHAHDTHRTILWTSSYSDAVETTLKKFDLKFHYHNLNPECPNSDLCHFDHKFYFNLILDDKSGFEGEKDWRTIQEAVIANDAWDSYMNYPSPKGDGFPLSSNSF